MNNNHYRKLGATDIVPPLVAIAGTIIWISIDGFTGESIAESLTALCTMFVILIPLYKHILEKPKDTHLEAGTKACQAVQKMHPEILSGPKYGKTDYTPGEPHPDYKYLFIQKPESRRKAIFVPISPLKKAILEFSISQDLLDLLNVNCTFTEASKKLHDLILGFATQRHPGLFIETDTKDIEDVCIVLDYDIEKVSVTEFRKIVQDVVAIAVKELEKMRC